MNVKVFYLLLYSLLLGAITLSPLTYTVYIDVKV